MSDSAAQTIFATIVTVVGIIIDLLQKVFHAVLSMLQSSDMKPKATTPRAPAQTGVKVNPRDPQYQTLAGINNDETFGTKNETKTAPTARPQRPSDPAQEFIKANPRDPNYQTLALVQNVEFDDKKGK